MDPITIALLAQAAIGAGKAGYGAWQKRQGNRQLDAAYEAPTGKPSEYADMIQQARASEVAQRRLEEINRSMGTSTAALQQGGSRALIGGIGAVTGAGSAAKTQALSQQQSEIMQALQMSAMGAERERARQVERQRTEEARAMAAINAGAENIAGGISDIASAGVGYASASSQGLIGGQTPAKVSGLDMNQTLTAQDQMIRNDFDKQIQNITAKGISKKPSVFISKDGGAVKTPGEFSHKSNPIDIMKDGAKIGEMTGGEYIFNPNQAKSLQKLAKSGDSDLHKFVRTLLNKPQFK